MIIILTSNNFRFFILTRALICDVIKTFAAIFFFFYYISFRKFVLVPRIVIFYNVQFEGLLHLLYIVCDKKQKI